MKASEDMQLFFQLEASLHKREVRSSRKNLSDLLADDFIEFGSSGHIFNKTEIIEALAKESGEPNITIRDFAARELAPGVVLVTYISESPTADDLGRTRSLRSSIWKLIGENWQMVFHQGTRTSS